MVQNAVVSSPAPPLQISKPMKTFERYQSFRMVLGRLSTASRMKKLRSVERASDGSVRTYEMHGRPPFVPTHTSQVPSTPSMLTAGYVTRPMRCADGGS